MPLKDEQVAELHRKMPNVTSETVEKTKLLSSEVLLLLLAATATCYMLLVHQTQLPTTGCPYLLLLLVNRTSNKSTCRQQNTLLLKDELAPESPPKAPADSKTQCH